MGADDEGFIDKAKTIQRTIGASDDDMKLLIAKRFLIPFDSGVVVIRHWRIHNYIRSDRFQSTLHQDEKTQLEYDHSKTAMLKPLENVIPNGYHLDTQDRVSKVSLDKDSLTTYTEEVEAIPYKEIIEYLNTKTGKNYRDNVQKNKSLIKARWSEGYRLDDFKQVIDNTIKDWSGTKYAKYLRPETLFGTKFDSYLNQGKVVKREKKTDERLGF